MLSDTFPNFPSVTVSGEHCTVLSMGIRAPSWAPTDWSTMVAIMISKSDTISKSISRPGRWSVDNSGINVFQDFESVMLKSSRSLAPLRRARGLVKPWSFIWPLCKSGTNRVESLIEGALEMRQSFVSRFEEITVTLKITQVLPPTFLLLQSSIQKFPLPQKSANIPSITR